MGISYINVKRLNYLERIKILQKLKVKFPNLKWNNGGELVYWYKKTYETEPIFDIYNYFKLSSKGFLYQGNDIINNDTELKLPSIKDKLK
jgi:hypothetical protein